MNDKQETIADIATEMRGLVKPGETLEHTYELLNGLAERIEAAYRVETLRWVEANAGLAKLIDPEKMLTGNGAKMHEVVELLARVILPPQEEYPAEYGGGKVPDKDGWLAWIRQAQSYAKSVLAAPPRNCDVYNGETCRMAYHMKGLGLMTMQAFADWLFAPYESEDAK